MLAAAGAACSVRGRRQGGAPGGVGTIAAPRALLSMFQAVPGHGSWWLRTLDPGPWPGHQGNAGGVARVHGHADCVRAAPREQAARLVAFCVCTPAASYGMAHLRSIGWACAAVAGPGWQFLRCQATREEISWNLAKGTAVPIAVPWVQACCCACWGGGQAAATCPTSPPTMQHESVYNQCVAVRRDSGERK